ncbi:YciI family protein [Plastoroseomonas arctica]|uniref:YCII-related domain-containing protein n=1 Tax=Plastoroseomonas arctica TaxID=1509237 RepID=A0AAF1K6P2_9PROT|nr:YciI family protein [Plastoroseomonas arctica]MBR0656751.1 hypothetical protein [Plastoroseomonas arctica]
MPRFLAVYMMEAENVARFRRLPKSEQDAIDARGVQAWAAWEAANAARFADRGGMVGKTRRVSRDGMADAANAICGYVIVEADSIDAAARLFENHPHFAIFPGDTVDIMPFVTEPPQA